MKTPRRAIVPLIRRVPLAVLIAAVALAAAACGSSSTSTSSPSGTASAGSTSSSPSSLATVSVAKNTTLGQGILVGSNGRTVYMFEKDTSGKSSCSGSCTAVWPPLTTVGKPQAGSGASASLIGTTVRSDGKTQVTYNGHPLYSYVSDNAAGQVNGQGLKQFGALWYVLSPQGNAISSGATPSGGGGYGGGGY
jgi:predicted lipoprotein with Yx(FWY)xxD motif